MSTHRLPLLVLFSLPFACLFGQAAPANGFLSERPVARAVALEQPPTLDGNVLGDSVWARVPTIGGLVQSRPYAGEPASERTEVRIAYDEENLYLGVVCYDSEPDKLVVSDARRDASLENDDAVSFILDTYHDGQNGFMFGTNPLGTEFDAQVDNEGQGNRNANRQQTGTIGGFNLNWDASWIVRTETGPYGWSAEFAIPLRTLRFRSGEQTWGFNFRRNIRKTNEVAYWAPLPIEFDLKRLSLAGSLTGLNLQTPGNLKLIPYALGQLSRDYSTDPAETDFQPEFGADLKFSVTPSLTLDLTYNTDFAQVEVDEQQINLDRFNLFFPEKRPFFLENAGLFSVGSPGEVDLFFSRRIGIGPQGELVPIIGGARLSGKVNRTNLGFLSMFTEDVPEAGIQDNNYTVARVNHEFAQRSAVGALFVNRIAMGESGEDYNRTFAADGKLGLGQKAQLSGFYARTFSPGEDAREHAYKFQARYEWNGLILNGAYTEVAPGFNPEVGFLLRESFRKPEFLIWKRIRTPDSKIGLLEVRPHISWRAYWNFDDFLETSFLHIDNHWEFKNGTEVHTGINFTVEGVVEDFEIVPGVVIPADTYRHSEAQIVFFTNRSKPFFVSTRHFLGGAFGGERYTNTLTLGLRLGDKFTSEFTLIRNDFDIPGGKFDTNILRTRLSYSFTPRLFLQSLLQYNDVSDTFSANIRFGWLQDANTGLFVVINALRDDGDPAQRSFIVKYSRLFDLMK